MYGLLRSLNLTESPIHGLSIRLAIESSMHPIEDSFPTNLAI